VFKALELIEFADLIPPLQAELQGTLMALYRHRCHVSQTLPISHCPSNLIHVSVYRDLAKNKKVTSGAGASSSAPPARNKSSSTAVQRGKGKERVTEAGESSVSAPPPNAPGAPPIEPLPHVQGDDAHTDGPTTDVGTYAEQDDGEDEGEGDDEDRTELDQPELEAEDEVEEHEAEDMDDVDEDVDMNMDADTREVGDVDDEDEME